MSYAPGLFSASVNAGNVMSLLTGYQSASNGSPSASSSSVGWLTLPPTVADGISYSSPVLMRAIPVSSYSARSRVGDTNDDENYKEHAGIYTYRSTTTSNQLHEFSSDDECVFYRAAPSEIIVEQLAGHASSHYTGAQFDNAFNHAIVWRIGP
jgi:hypothetical protein